MVSLRYLETVPLANMTLRTFSHLASLSRSGAKIKKKTNLPFATFLTPSYPTTWCHYRERERAWYKYVSKR